jgi:hypothetical protein
MTIYRGPGGTGSATSDSDTTQFQGFVTQAEDARDAAQTAQTAAELAETNAETAEANAETAEANAEAAQAAAEAAQAAAEAAQTAAEAAQTAAELAETNAETAEANAETAASEAADSATLAGSFIPSQTGNAGKYLTTDGTDASWGTISSGGTVTSVSGTGTVSGLSLSGTVTSSGSLTLGGTLAVTASDFSSQTANTFLAAPNGSSGTPTFRAMVAADVPTLNQNTTGTAANVSGTVAIANGGTGATSASAARTALGLAIGTNVQAWDADLDTWATKTAPTGTVIGTSDTQTLTNKTITNLVFDGNYTEEVFTITDGASVDLNPANGTVQLWTLGANRSPTATSFAAGQSMTLMVADGTAYTITWPSVTWVGGSAPTLATTGYTVIELWEVGTTLYGALVGSVA